MAGAYKMAHKNAPNCPKLFGGQFAAFLCMIVYMRILPALSGYFLMDYLIYLLDVEPWCWVSIFEVV